MIDATTKFAEFSILSKDGVLGRAAKDAGDPPLFFTKTALTPGVVEYKAQLASILLTGHPILRAVLLRHRGRRVLTSAVRRTLGPKIHTTTRLRCPANTARGGEFADNLAGCGGRVARDDAEHTERTIAGTGISLSRVRHREDSRPVASITRATATRVRSRANLSALKA